MLNCTLLSINFDMKLSKIQANDGCPNTPYIKPKGSESETNIFLHSNTKLSEKLTEAVSNPTHQSLLLSTLPVRMQEQGQKS